MRKAKPNKRLAKKIKKPHQKNVATDKMKIIAKYFIVREKTL